MTVTIDLQIPRKKIVGAETRRKKTGITFSIFLGVAISFILLFSVAGSHAFLVSVQQEVDSLQRQITEGMGNSRELRIEVAELKNPERILSAAEGRLNMLPPPNRKQLRTIFELPPPLNNPFRRSS
ncbi:MAG: hypothetical protein QF837_04365 [Acidimicrobiales bacterium]|jgi:cell division protein FtsL|nr:hypothetical protein [Acidimicrobiaceae bacterium]MDP6161897.1 hypothetical protein [Acidimicrobiales bacterium]HJL90793.1 hypothetical protein [Acidimicrobiales bacterium]HJO41748.1 hypothetical protein [Acidimicrobiales bacterium]|tara:strand:- start:2921 stop:3298 length:378 start_codon:yes stop_codon:yes gene_type:complete